MAFPAHIFAADRDLIRDVDRAMAESAERCGAWLVCRPGCTACCIGPFLITPLDTLRLQAGLSVLKSEDPARGGRVLARASEYVERFAHIPLPELLGCADADEAPCPALDPETGTCDLYEFRPMTCRVFGPPAGSTADALGVCELCFQGASDAEIAACRVHPDPGNREAALLIQIQQACGGVSDTLVGFALANHGGWWR